MWGGRWRRRGRCSSTGRWCPGRAGGAAGGAGGGGGGAAGGRCGDRGCGWRGRASGGWCSCSRVRGRSGRGWAGSCWRRCPVFAARLARVRRRRWRRYGWLVAGRVLAGAGAPGLECGGCGAAGAVGGDGVAGGGVAGGRGRPGCGGGSFARVRSRRRVWRGCCRWRTARGWWRCAAGRWRRWRAGRRWSRSLSRRRGAGAAGAVGGSGCRWRRSTARRTVVVSGEPERWRSWSRSCAGEGVRARCCRSTTRRTRPRWSRCRRSSLRGWPGSCPAARAGAVVCRR